MNTVFLLLLTFIMGTEFLILASLVDGLIVAGVKDEVIDPMRKAVTYFFLVNVILITLLGLWKKASLGKPQAFINRGGV